MSYWGNSGYIGQSMSVRAYEAYDDGQAPASKWTKKAILEALEEVRPDLVEDAKALTKEELKNLFLTWTGWHHTGKYFQKVDFYGLKEAEELEEVTGDTIEEIIATRPPVERKPRGPKKAPKKLTAVVKYLNWWKWGGWHSEEITAVIHYTEGQKLVKTPDGNKRLEKLSVWHVWEGTHGEKQTLAHWEKEKRREARR